MDEVVNKIKTENAISHNFLTIIFRFTPFLLCRNNGNHSCTQTCRKLSFDNENDHEPAIQGGTAALILGTEILVSFSDKNSVKFIEKFELFAGSTIK